jgi:serine/threonine protein phosphatase PrpC
MGLRCSDATHAGGRAHNQDAWLSRPDLGIWAVADGAGGHADGAAAAQAVVAALAAIPPGLSATELLAQVRLRLDAVHAALSVTGPSASTAVVLIACGRHFACLWAGDSRAYRLRDGVLRQLTRDHSLIEDLLEAGEIEAEQAEGHPQANVITRAIGGGEHIPLLDKVSDRLRIGDRFLLCSDGLYRVFQRDDLAQLAARGSGAAEIMEAAIARTPEDNLTLVVIDVACAPTEQQR